MWLFRIPSSEAQVQQEPRFFAFKKKWLCDGCCAQMPQHQSGYRYQWQTCLSSQLYASTPEYRICFADSVLAVSISKKPISAVHSVSPGRSHGCLLMGSVLVLGAQVGQT